jgi:hypothetical protein
MASEISYSSLKIAHQVRESVSKHFSYTYCRPMESTISKESGNSGKKKKKISFSRILLEKPTVTLPVKNLPAN